MQTIPEIPYKEYRAKYVKMSLGELETAKRILEKVVENQEVIIEYLRQEEEDEKLKKESYKLRNLKGELSTLENMYSRKYIEMCHANDKTGDE